MFCKSYTAKRHVKWCSHWRTWIQIQVVQQYFTNLPIFQWFHFSWYGKMKRKLVCSSEAIRGSDFLAAPGHSPKIENTITNWRKCCRELVWRWTKARLHHSALCLPLAKRFQLFHWQMLCWKGRIICKKNSNLIRRILTPRLVLISRSWITTSKLWAIYTSGKRYVLVDWSK